MDLNIELIAIIASIASVISAIFSFRLFFEKKKYTPENAISLLKIGKPEVWNEVRIKYPHWIPNIDKLKISQVDLTGIDLSKSNILNSEFKNVNFDNAKINKTNIMDTKFIESSFEDSIFKSSNLYNIKFNKSSFDRCLFFKSNLKEVDFTDTIINSIRFEDSTIVDAKNLIKDTIETPALGIDSINDEDFNALEFLESISEFDLEQLLINIFKQKGYEVITNEERNDIGYDFMIQKKELWGTEKIAVEVKKISPSKLLHSNTMVGLLAITEIRDIDKVILVTTGRLSKLALEITQSNSKIKIIDGMKLIELISSMKFKN